nr:hypothetical protein Itr_chr14CG32070 [Ipomoea trifida]GMD29014.1 hypothetical protein Iba_scaffold43298CG0240 [Ipomoea batatas]GMD84771.1 hypothetical protein Iba_chr14aCG17880 [Ipomoea batatas]GME06162.1 hypothetical protein Iba_scaffold3961.4CG0650 [Ipomoea batatas]
MYGWMCSAGNAHGSRDSFARAYSVWMRNEIQRAGIGLGPRAHGAPLHSVLRSDARESMPPLELKLAAFPATLFLYLYSSIFSYF